MYISKKCNARGFLMLTVWRRTTCPRIIMCMAVGYHGWGISAQCSKENVLEKYNTTVILTPGVRRNNVGVSTSTKSTTNNNLTIEHSAMTQLHHKSVLHYDPVASQISIPLWCSYIINQNSTVTQLHQKPALHIYLFIYLLTYFTYLCADSTHYPCSMLVRNNKQ